MSTVETGSIRRAEALSLDPAVAAQTLAEELHQDQMAGVIFFCSDQYDPKALAAELRTRFDCPIVGCTSAGEIGSRYQENSIVGVSFGSEDFCLHPRLVRSLADFGANQAQEMADSIRADLKFSADFEPDNMFGLVLLDGLSVKEESATIFIHSVLQGVSLVGGSAGGSLEFKETRVFAEGEFHTGAGVFLMVESKLPFRAFKLQHFVPSETDMVITEANPSTRTVMEIDGGPAAKEYAKILGLGIDVLTPQVFSRHPLMLQIGEEWYVRSIQKVNPDGSLTFFCAIDEGLPLTIARGVGFVETLKAKVAELEAEFSSIECTLGFDCVFRKLELVEIGKVAQVETALAPLNFVGFSTFGEQYKSAHINQTLTGVVLGER